MVYVFWRLQIRIEYTLFHAHMHMYIRGVWNGAYVFDGIESLSLCVFGVV